MEGTTRKRLAKGRGLLAATITALLAIALLAVGLTSPTRASASTFPDVPQGTWYATWVEQASEAGLMTGYGPGSRQGQFGPGDAITRAQVATVLWRMADSPEPAGAAGFPDVEQGSWYADAVAWCAEQGVVTGYEAGPNEGKFVPDGQISRQELAAMSWRWAKWAKVDVTCPDPAAFESATDWRSVSDFAVEPMTWTAAAGVLSGLDNHDGTFTLDPSGTATRAMAAKVFVVLSGKPVAPKASHTVTFESNGGSAVASQSVTCGEAASAPDAPEKLGYTFDGWFSDEALAKAYDFAASPVTSDITLYAKWAARPCALLYPDGTLSLQIGPEADADSHGGEPQSWEWDCATAPWADASDSVTSVIAQKGLALSGDCSDLFSHLTACKSMDLENLDVSGVTSFSDMFLGDSALTTLDISGWKVSSVTDFYRMFSGCSSLASLDLSGWDTSSVIDLGYMFSGCSSLTDLDLSDWDVSTAGYLNSMFSGCSKLESLDLTGWNMSSVWELEDMFSGCSSLTDLDLSGWNVSEAVYLNDMFSGCSKLETLNLSGWDVSSAFVDGMFEECDSLVEVTLGAGCGEVAGELPSGPWCKKGGDAYDAIPAEALPGTFLKGRTVTFESNGGSEVASLIVLNGGTAAEPDAPAKDGLAFVGWFSDEALEQPYNFENTPVTSNITLHAKWGEAGAYAVLYSDGLLSLQLGDYTYAQKHGSVLEKWEWDRASSPWAETYRDKITSVVARDRISLTGDCSFMFSYLDEEDVVELCGLPNCESMDLKRLDVSGVTSFADMFYRALSLKSLDITGWDVSSAKELEGMFLRCSKLESLDVSGWNTAKVTYFNDIFGECSSLTTLDVSGWDVSSAETLSCMFSGCSGLSSLDLSGWDVSSAIRVGYMFSDCPSLVELDLSGWDLSSATDPACMFSGCSSLASLDLSRWNVSKATDLSGMFSGCESLASLDLSGWGVSKAAYLNDMFSGCSKLEALNLSGWGVSSYADLSSMFSGCSALTTLNLSGWDVSEDTRLDDMFEECGALAEVTLSDGCAKVAGELPSGPWCKKGGDTYDSIPADALPGTFLKGRAVTFDSDGGTEVASQVVPNGATAAAPETPEKLDCLFGGWYIDEAFDQPYDFESTPVTSDITLHAKWDEAQAYAVLYSDGLLSLQLGGDVDTETHGNVLEKWEWDRTTSPWIYTADRVKSIVARDRISLSGYCAQMFSNADSLSGLPSCVSMDLKRLDVSDVTCFNGMFYGDTALTTLDLSGWDVSSATDLSWMFTFCSQLTALNLSGWDVPSGANLGFMFRECDALVEVTLSEGCAPLAGQLGGPWCKKGGDAYAAISAEALPGTFVKGHTVTFNSNGGSEVASQVVPNGATAAAPETPEKLDCLFAGWYIDEAFDQPYDFESTPVTSDITLHAKWDEAQAYAVLYSDGLLSLQLGADEDTELHGTVLATWEWDRTSSPWADEEHYKQITSIVARDKISLSGDCASMFSHSVSDEWEGESSNGLPNCESMDLKNLDVSGVTSFQYMFCFDASESLDLSGWDVSSAQNLCGMFADCSNLTSLDLSGWDVSSATDFSSMFYCCSSLSSLDLSGWNPSSATKLYGMFQSCSSLTTLDLSGWDVSKAQQLHSMFSRCSNLTTLDLSGWDVSKVMYLFEMFYNCTSLESLNLSGWNPSSVMYLNNMFYGCGSLVEVTLGEGCAKVAGELPSGPWCKKGGDAYTSISAEALPGTFVKGHTVTFNSNGGSEVASLIVPIGETATEPDAPVKDSLAFAGWYSDEALQTPYDFSAPVTTDIILYAKWGEAKTYAVLYSDGLLSLQLGDYAYAQKHGSVVETWEWDRSSSPWADNADNVTSVVVRDKISLSGNCKWMFSGLYECMSMNLKNLDVSGATNLSNMFNGCESLLSLDLSSWDVSKVEWFVGMFCGCTGLESLDLSSWDVVRYSATEGFYSTFQGCDALSTVTLGKRCTYLIDALGGPWYKGDVKCDKITTSDLPGTFVRGRTVTFDADGGTEVASLTVPNGQTVFAPDAPTKFGYTFEGWYSDTECAQAYDFEGTAVTRDVTLHAKWVARPCALLYPDGTLSLQLGSEADGAAEHGGDPQVWEWDCVSSQWSDEAASVTSVVARDKISLSGDCSGMFSNLVACTSMDLKNLDVSGVTSFFYMFGCSSEEGSTPSLVSLDLSGWNVSGAENFSGMFLGCASLASLDLSGWNPSSATNLSYMFNACAGLTSLEVSGWDVSKVTDFSGMFAACSSLASLDLFEWDVSSAENLCGMFAACSSLAGLDLSKWDVSSVEDLSGMFEGDSALTTPGVSGWDVSSVKNLSYMFSNCSKLESLDLSGWDVTKVMDLSYMFEDDSALTTLTLSNWSLPSATDLRGMFSGDSALTTLVLSGWSLPSATDLSYMFLGCSKLESLDLSSWSLFLPSDLAYMFSGDSALTALNLSGWEISTNADFYGIFDGCEALAVVTMDEGGALLGDLLPSGPWYDSDGNEYASFPAYRLPDTYTRINPATQADQGAQTPESSEGAATFDDVAGEEDGLTSGDGEESPESGVDADSGVSADADTDVDAGTLGGDAVDAVDASDVPGASDSGDTFDVSDASDAPDAAADADLIVDAASFADADQASASDAPADGADGAAVTTAEQAYASADSEDVEFVSEEVSDLAA